MESHVRKLLVIVCEAALERALGDAAERLGAHGWTTVDARGRGSRGVRDASWEPDRSIRMEIICDDATAEAMLKHLHEHYFADYAMVVYTAEVGVLRPEKF